MAFAFFNGILSPLRRNISSRLSQARLELLGELRNTDHFAVATPTAFLFGSGCIKGLLDPDMRLGDVIENK